MILVWNSVVWDCWQYPRVQNHLSMSQHHWNSLSSLGMTAIHSDFQLSKVLQYGRKSWPEMILDALSPLWQRQSELMVEGDSVLRGVRVVVQTATASTGRAAPKSPGCFEDEGPSLQLCVVARIRQRGWRQTCFSCQAVKHTPAKAPLNPWAWPTSPWECIHVDFVGPVAERMLSWCMVVHHM